MVKGERGFKPFRMNGKKWYVLYEPFVRSKVPGRALEDLRWSVGVVYPEDDIFGEYNQLLTYVLVIAFVGLALFLLLCLLLTRHQLLPLNMLTQSVQRIADGHYEETIPDTQRDDEVGLLQQHFQHMQQSLATHVSELKELTDTLQERGKVLQKAQAQAQEADRMKTAFLHNMTNQMIAPSEVIVEHVQSVCDHYHDMNLEAANHELQTIEQQSRNIIELITSLVRTSEQQTEEKEDRP